MHVLVLSKRQYTGKDLLDDAYGRLYEIPAGLAARGHEVTGLALSYRTRREGWYRSAAAPNMAWLALNALPTGWLRHGRVADDLIAERRPDVIWACSDALHAVAGDRLGRRHGIPLVIDLYDNFESFALSRLPGVTPLLRTACRRAAGLTVVSHALAEFVARDYAPRGRVQVLGNGVRRDLFRPQDRAAARAALGLPIGVRIIGTAGAIAADRGIADLFEAFLALADKDETLWLAYAGPRDATPSRYRHPRIVDLGVLPLARAALLYAALDVAVVCNRDTTFGRYCFPLKLHEIIACGVPLVAAALGDVQALLAATPENLYRAGDIADLAARIAAQIEAPQPVRGIEPPDWSAVSGACAAFFHEVIGAPGG